jgi:hypothetical protein
MAAGGGAAAAELHVPVLLTCVGRAADIVDTLGRRTHGGSQTLFELAEADPQVLKKWVRSTSRDPLLTERRIFARLCLALVDGGYALGFDRGPPAAPPLRAQPGAEAAPVQQPPEPQLAPFAGPAPRVVQRRAAVTRAVRSPDVLMPPWVHLALTWARAFWLWAPTLMTVVAVFLACLLTLRPEWLVFLPAKGVSLIWFYLQFAGGRVLARLDNEVGQLFGFTHYPAPGLAGADPNAAAVDIYRPPVAAAPSVSMLGWIMAACAMFRH